MQISIKWINELVNVKEEKLDDLIEKLILGGFEVEETLELRMGGQSQFILDIAANANRSDSLSIQGISLEISALLSKSISISTYSIKSESLKQIILQNTRVLPVEQYCNLLSSVIIENLIDLTVPKWVTQKLISSGIIPLGNLLDFQRYILLETGYPFTFYDLSLIHI